MEFRLHPELILSETCFWKQVFLELQSLSLLQIHVKSTDGLRDSANVHEYLLPSPPQIPKVKGNPKPLGHQAGCPCTGVPPVCQVSALQVPRLPPPWWLLS